MAPALSIALREQHIHDSNVFEETDKPLSLRRRALVSVDNLATHMEEDDLGLQNQPSLAKDSQEMEQILVDLGSSDLAQTDLLQGIKTPESGGDAMSTGDPDTIFPLPGFDLPETVDSEGDAVEDKIKGAQIRLERRCSLLQRRLRILQARAIGKRISEEGTITFEKCTRGARRDGGGRPVGLKTFLKTVETTAALQASAASRAVTGPKYFNPGTSKSDASRSACIGIPSGTLTGLEDTAGALRSHLTVVKHELDSDATASSSGAESNDEAVTYNNPQQQQMPIDRRALWSWQRARASIASRWCWLQAQVHELEYKIRQHNELHKQVREAKGSVEFEGEPVGYLGSLPGSEMVDDDPSLETCARVRPLRRETFKKRKLLQMHNLHIATNKAAKPADIKCSCQQGSESCAVCTGRAEPTQPAPPFCTMSKQQRIAAVDPGYHPVLSDIKDVPAWVHVAALSARVTPARGARAARGSHHAAHAPHHAHPAPPARPPQHHHAPKPTKRHTKLKRGRPPLTRKVRERERDDETSTSGHERSRGRSSTESRSWRRQSYDIDNIVIPQSVAANTKPQILNYKEIITPKWRVLDIKDAQLNNGVMKSNRMSIESEEEDVSDAAVSLRHIRAESRERARYVRKQRVRRSQHEQREQHEQRNQHEQRDQHEQRNQRDQHEQRNQHEQRDQHEQRNQHEQHEQRDQHDQRDQHEHEPPDEAQPPPPQAQQDAPPLLRQSTPPQEHAPPQHETVRPYTPRRFPLADAAYVAMLAAMPAGFRAASRSPRPPSPSRSPSARAPSPSPRAPSPPRDSDSSSTLSPAETVTFDGDDPDDAEWEPHADRAERRKSSFR